MKKLIYFPIVHNQVDLGSMGSQLSLAGEQKYGELWKEHLKEVDLAWNKIGSYVNQIENLRIYQDGLPVAGDIGIRIVKDVANSGSKNYKIIENLISNGAVLEIAESKELLLKEYNFLNRITNAITSVEKLKANILYKDESEKLLSDRDEYIANQINTTLNDGEIGVAFFGGAHSIVDKLNNDIEVIVIQMFKDEISLSLINK